MGGDGIRRLIKTTNNGISFQHQFDSEATVALVPVAVAKSDPNIVWVGTGENNPRNSVSYGNGVYKSLDGGKTWKNMGLTKSFQIGTDRNTPTDATRFLSAPLADCTAIMKSVVCTRLPMAENHGNAFSM